MRTNLIMLFLAAAFFIGCEKQEKSTSRHFNGEIVIKISVLQSGKILADGSEISLADLDARLSQIQNRNGVVWIYHEGDPGKNLMPIWRSVVDLVGKHGLPVSQSRKSDFSDYMDEKGVSHPRK
jgi:hypothetical protein